MKCKGSEIQVQKELKTLAMDTMNMLQNSELITFDEDLYGVTATDLGKIMSKNYISKQTIDQFSEVCHLVMIVTSHFAPE